MQRAMTSLPTPLSPRISTGMSDVAARSAMRSTPRIEGAEAIMSSNFMPPSALRDRRFTSPVRLCIFRAFRILTTTRSGLAGLTMKSTAPRRIDCTIVSIPLVAVSMITGRSDRRSASLSSVSMPESPGIVRSSSTTSIASRASHDIAIPVSPSGAVRQAKPAFSTAACSRRRWVGSSSITRIVLAMVLTLLVLSVDGRRTRAVPHRYGPF